MVKRVAWFALGVLAAAFFVFGLFMPDKPPLGAWLAAQVLFGGVTVFALSRYARASEP